MRRRCHPTAEKIETNQPFGRNILRACAMGASYIAFV
jgi:hypothetical protein